MRRWALWVGIVASCGDNTLPVGQELLHARDLAIVAHSDDDLVYFQPDQLEQTRLGGATIVYVTDGRDDADRRHAGIMHAYTAATGFEDWQCGWLDVAGHFVEHCRLGDARLSLVFLGYPEGDRAGTDPTSIARLWDGTLEVAISIGDLTASYTRDDILTVLTAIVDLTAPQTVRTLDLAGVHGIEHADHAIVGAAALLAVAAAKIEAGKRSPDVISFRADGTGADPATLIDPLFERSAGVLAFYDACAERTAECGEPAPVLTEEHSIALRRRYATSFRLAAGQLRLGAGVGCAQPADAGKLEIVACPGAVSWRLDPDGTLHAGDSCIEILQGNGELLTSPSCEPTPARRFFLDDEGHLWSGMPPPAGPGGALYCVSVLGGRPHAAPCGATSRAIWELTPDPTIRARPANLPIGRAVRMGDLDRDGFGDLCAVINNKLRCAPGDGTGQFGALADIGPLAVEPESLVLGDVDGDGTLDACGRDSAGLLCAPAPQFAPLRWSPAFARSGPANASDRSLAAVDSDNNGSAEICGVGPTGVVCAKNDPVNLPAPLSTWPAPTAPLWPADLDGDRRADWCSRTATNVSCGTRLLASLTTDGVPWTYSLSGIVDPFPPDLDLGDMVDVDADGRADLCGIFDRGTGPQIACARSQGFGFGPLALLAALPAATYQALYVGDLDGDRRGDACADDGTNLVCALSR